MKKIFKKCMAFFLITAMALGVLIYVPNTIEKARADENNATAKTIAGLGTSAIADPAVPTGFWNGSYVYFGTYDTDGDNTAEPVKYRVLDSNTTVFGGTTMLLDCDSILWTGAFGVYRDNQWSSSLLKTELNDTFLNNSFSELENNAILESTVSNHAYTTDSNNGVNVTTETQNLFYEYGALNNDKVFLLDAEDISNNAYGYSVINDDSLNRKKEGGDGTWWLRTAVKTDSRAVGYIDADGEITSYYSAQACGVSPALNINLSSVLFSSVISGTAGETGAEYKLTLLDSEMTIAGNGTVTRNEDTVTIPYTVSGTNSANVTQVSVLLLDKEYTAGNTNNADVLFYGALNDDDSFTLPEELSYKVCGRDYYAYIVAEDVNGTYETDYASAPENIFIPWLSKKMSFGINGMVDPIVPTSTSDAWTGSYVYFGTYNGSPVKYRVLDSNTTVFGGTTMLLDCDSVLWGGGDPNSTFDEDTGFWAYSDIRIYLRETFLTGNFSIAEQDAIASSTKNAPDSSDGDGWSRLNYVELINDKIFFLDAKEATNESYGYSDTDAEAANRVKTGGNGYWWLRSIHRDGDYITGCVDSDRCISAISVWDDDGGVSPALNINLSSVFLTTAIGTSKSSALTADSTAIGTTTGVEWKLTLSDNRKTVAVTENEVVYKASNGTITVPYTYTDTATTAGEKVNQISVMITDKAYTEADAQILYYGALQGTTFTAANGKGTFALPNGLNQKVMGTDYHLYILAEHVNTTNVTDYASAPVEITKIYDEVNSFDIIVDAPVAKSALDTSATASSEIETAVVTWMNGESTVTGNAGYNTAYTVKITITAIDGCVITENIDITINSNAVTALKNNDGTITVSYTFPVTEMGAITHTASGYEGTYDGNEHSITVNVGDLEGATITYSVDTGDNKTYSATKPTYTDVGTYTVYYKIEKDNYETITGSMTVKITDANSPSDGNHSPGIVDPDTGINIIAVIAPILIVALGGVVMNKRRRMME